MGHRLQKFRLSLGRIFREPLSVAARSRRTSRVISREIEQGMRMMAIALLAQGFGAAFLTAALWGLGRDALILCWGAFVAAGIVFSVDFYYRFHADKDRVAHIRRWLRTDLALAAAAGLVWGGAGAVFPLALPGTVPGVMTAGAVIVTVLASWPFFAMWLPGLLIFVVLALVPTAVSILVNNFDISEGLIAGFFIVVGCLILYSGRRLNDVILASIIAESENRALLERLQRERKTAEAARREAENGSRRRQAFFRAANHDLRQPLQAMGIYLQVLKMTAPEGMKSAVKQLSSCAESISGLVGQILEVSRINADTFEVRRELVSVPEYFEELSREFCPIAESRGGRFVTRPRDLKIDIDRFLVARVIRNLVGNAYKFCDKERPVVILSAKSLPGGKVQISVHDNGPGITPEDRGSIFNPFYRSESARGVEGYGLGLSIVSGICGRLGIGLSVVSSPGRGSVFRLTLGEETAASEPSGLVARAEEKGPAVEDVEPLKAKILCLEDNVTVSSSVRTLLAGWGAEVKAAPFLDDATLEAMEEFRPDVVLADFALGEGAPNGIESILRLSHRLKTNIPSVILTAVPEDMVEAEWRRRLPTRPLADMPEILRKPVEAARLKAALRTALRAGGAWTSL